MSSDNLDPTTSRASYLWNSRLEAADYAVAVYRLETSADPELAAVAMAKEQSAGTELLPGSRVTGDFGAWTARVKAVEKLGETSETMLPAYRLKTPVYESGPQRPSGYHVCRVEIAYPCRMFGRDLTQLWNAVGGELYRLGFINALRLLDLELPAPLLAAFPGPRHGAEGLRRRLNFQGRPVFCRSTRPAVGLSTADMLRINEQVLRGGFDAVKDDELTPDAPPSPFAERVRDMAAMARRVEDAAGERKLYFANVITEVREALARARLAQRAGVDGLLVSPMLQGLEIARVMAEETGLPVLAHNTWEDAYARHPRFGVSQPLHLAIQRLVGADLVMLPGAFATGSMPAEDERACAERCLAPGGRLRAVMPIIAGGKTPEGLAGYVRAVGSPDFMVIAAAAVDHHPGGLAAGARAFREAWEQLVLQNAGAATP